MHAIAITYRPYLPRIAAALACACALMAFTYGVLLLATVAHAAGRESAQRQVDVLTMQLSDLEGKYLAATSAITPQRAQELGFVPASSPEVVAAGPQLEALTLR